MSSWCKWKQFIQPFPNSSLTQSPFSKQLALKMCPSWSWSYDVCLSFSCFFNTEGGHMDWWRRSWLLPLVTAIQWFKGYFSRMIGDGDRVVEIVTSGVEQDQWAHCCRRQRAGHCGVDHEGDRPTRGWWDKQIRLQMCFPISWSYQTWQDVVGWSTNHWTAWFPWGRWWRLLHEFGPTLLFQHV